jgi:hypothetical protein
MGCGSSKVKLLIIILSFYMLYMKQKEDATKPQKVEGKKPEVSKP